MKARCERATDGPWENDVGDYEIMGTWPDDGTVAVVAEVKIVPPGFDNAEFIAHARQDLPRLIAEIERLTKLDNYELGYREGESSAVADYQLALDGVMEGDCLPSEVSREIARLTKDLEVARGALERVANFDPEKDTEHEKVHDEWGEAESFRMCQQLAQEALQKLSKPL